MLQIRTEQNINQWLGTAFLAQLHIEEEKTTNILMDLESLNPGTLHIVSHFFPLCISKYSFYAVLFVLRELDQQTATG